MAGIKLITVIQLWRKNKGGCGLHQRNLRSKGWRKTMGRADYDKTKRKGMLKSHPANAIIVARTPFPTEAVVWLCRQELARETVPSVGFHSLPVNWAQVTLCTAKRVFVGTPGLPPWWIRSASGLDFKDTALCKSTETEVLFLALFNYLQLINVKPPLSMLEELLQCTLFNCTPEKSYIHMWQSILPSLGLV